MTLEELLVDGFSLRMTPVQDSVREVARKAAQDLNRPHSPAIRTALGLDAIAGGCVEAGFAAHEFPAVLIAEELGAVDMEKALAVLVPLAALWLLRGAGDKASFDRLLAQWRDAGRGAGLAIANRADPQGPGWLVRAGGESCVVALAAEGEGGGLRVSCQEPGLTEPDRSAALRGGAIELATWRPDGAPAQGLAIARTALAPAIDEVVQMFGAILVGGMRTVLDAAFDHADQRRTFGKPIIQHQAVAIRLADMQIAFEGAELLLRRSASRAAASDRPGLVADQIAAAARAVFRDGLQVFAAHGFVAESLPGRFYRTGNVLAALLQAIARFAE